MLRTIALCWLAGVLAANALPHFVRGITRQEYPNLTGNSPVRNVIGGWVALVAAALLGSWSNAAEHPWPAAIAVAVGVLVMAIFHALGGAFAVNRRYGRAVPQG
jgi:hypothetical protein